MVARLRHARPRGPGAGAGAVRPGIDVLLSDSLAVVRGRRVGLVTNQAGVDARGISDVARLQAAGVRLVALFSPEHGFRGAADPGAAVASSIDSATGLPIYSLYGRTYRPHRRDARRASRSCWSICQDAGARYYTYLFTTIEVMRAAARPGIPWSSSTGRTRSAARSRATCSTPRIATPVGLLAVPMRYGMTLGELARLARSDLGLATDLRVVPVAGWRRAVPLDATGLPFIPPSPNLRRVESLYHYPGLCLFEGTNLSVGRGSRRRSSRSGRRGSTPRRCSRACERRTPRRPIRGRRRSRPSAAGRREVRRHGRRRYPARGHGPGRATIPTATAVHLLAAVYGVERRDRFAWIPAHFDRLAGGPTLREADRGGSAARFDRRELGAGTPPVRRSAASVL